MEYNSLKGLNAEQRDAAMFGDGYELILAGAGTGKTKTMTARAAYLIECGVQPESILMVTFTRAAANEMKSRIISMAGSAGEKVQVMTFHAWCALFLRQCGYRPGFRILSGSDADSRLKSLRKESISDLHVDSKEYPSVDQIRDVKNWSVERLISRKDAAEETGLTVRYSSDFIEDALALLDKYDANNLANGNRMDFCDLLSATYDLLSDNGGFMDRLFSRRLSDQWRAKYSYIMCDEYQDTDCIQYAILQCLAGNGGNLAVVGDDNQSIYRFRGADVGNILQFESDFPGAERKKLVENYRSTQEILDTANAVMLHAQDGILSHAWKGIRKDLVSGIGKHGPRPVLFHLEGPEQEAECIADLIEKRLADGVPAGEIAILTRQSFWTRKAEGELAKRRIRYVVHGGQPLLSKHSVIAVLDMIRLAEDPYDSDAAERCFRMVRGVGEKNVSELMTIMKRKGFHAMWNADGFAAKAYAGRVRCLVKGVLELRDLSLREQLRKLLRGGLYEEILDQCGVKEDDSLYIKKFDADALCVMAAGYDDVSAFMEAFSLDESDATVDQNDAVVISTIHSAKGLEYDTVFIVGMEETRMPMANESIEDNAEDLRCLYVAMTRAKERLFVTVTDRIVVGTDWKYASISPFLYYDDVMRCFDIVDCRRKGGYDERRGCYGRG